jgi:EF hand
MKSISMRRLAVAVAGLAAVAGVALAQGPGAGPGRGMEPATVAEMTQRAQEHAAEMDLDRDGFITAAEVRSFREQQRAARAAEKFARMDTNKDGKVSIAEFTTEHTARIQAMDANGDGTIERSEMRAGHRHGRHHGPRCAEGPAG